MEEVCKLAECTICGELKTDHRILVECGHSFCKDDIDSLISVHNGCYKCPICREPFRVRGADASMLVKDWNKIALTELVLNWKKTQTVPELMICFECAKPATVWCPEESCAFCDSHAKEAHKVGKAKLHKLVRTTNKNITSSIVKSPECRLHGRPLKSYCMKCDKAICVGKSCAEFSHAKNACFEHISNTKLEGSKNL